MTPLPFDDETRTCRIEQKCWCRTSIHKRLAIVREFRHRLVEHVDELTVAVEADVGRPPDEVLASDIMPLAAAAKFLERRAKKLLAPRSVGGAPIWLFRQRDQIYRRPWGVVGIIGTWNYPIFLNGVQLLQALVAGNGVLWKPSEYGAASARVLHRLLIESGFPNGLLHLLPPERDAGPRLVESDIDYLVFTGSAAVGRSIAARLGQRLIPSTLELSGCDAMFVLDDADVDLAARAAWFGMSLNRGQTCLAVRRIFVDQSIHDQFLSAIRPMIESAPAVRLISVGQCEQANHLIANAASLGGKVIASNRTVHGNEIVPRIVIGATPEMAICRADSFAPLASVLKFETLEQAREMNAVCRYGLGASIFTSNYKRGSDFAAWIEAGSISINDVIVSTAHPATPFGGRRDSGWGITQGAEGLRAMTVPQVVSRRAGRFRPHFDGASRALGAMLRGILDLTHARSLSQRVRGMIAAIRTGRKLGKRSE